MQPFPTTRWSLIQTHELTQEQLVAVWAELVQAYQPAILGYFRRRSSAQDAEDLTQEFLLRCMDEQWWARADPQAGSFRQFLSMLMKRFLAQHMATGYRRFEYTGIELASRADWQTPERYFDVQFLLRLTQLALEALRKEYQSDGRGESFAALEPWLVETPAPGELAALGRQVEVAPNTLAVQLKRMRQRLHKAVRTAIVDLSLNADCAVAEQQALRELLSEDQSHALE